MKARRGVFITFEGIDGCGKSTQAEFLSTWLAESSVCERVLRTFEPGGWSGGTLLRRLLLGDLNEAEFLSLAPRTELLLFLADRSGHLDTEISPALKRGQWVLCERYTDSTLAYQSWGRGIALEEIQGLLDWCCFPLPDLTILLDVEVQVAQSRLEHRGKLDRIEADSCSFMERVRQGYRELAMRFPERIVVVDAGMEAETVSECVRGFVSRRFPEAFA